VSTILSTHQESKHNSCSDFFPHFGVTVHDHVSRTFRDLPHNLLVRESSANSAKARAFIALLCQLAGDLRRGNVSHAVCITIVLQSPTGSSCLDTPRSSSSAATWPTSSCRHAQAAANLRAQADLARATIGAAAQQRLPPRLPWATDMATRIADRYEARRTAQPRAQQGAARCLEAKAAPFRPGEECVNGLQVLKHSSPFRPGEAAG
jgi:hypothetical protein